MAWTFALASVTVNCASGFLLAPCATGLVLSDADVAAGDAATGMGRIDDRARRVGARVVRGTQQSHGSDERGAEGTGETRASRRRRAPIETRRRLRRRDGGGARRGEEETEDEAYVAYALET